MSVDAYDQILNHLSDLTPEEQARLAHELTSVMARSGGQVKRHSVLELRGLGKEIWQGVDAADYVRQERASWPG